MTAQTLPPRRCWMLVTETHCQGVIPSVWSDDDRPTLFDTLDDATAAATDLWADHNDGLVRDILDQIAGIDPGMGKVQRVEEIQQILEDHQFDEEPMDWAVEVDVHPDGSISAVEDERRWSAADLRALRS